MSRVYYHHIFLICSPRGAGLICISSTNGNGGGGIKEVSAVLNVDAEITGGGGGNFINGEPGKSIDKTDETGTSFNDSPFGLSVKSFN